jgi:hypothetical protein
MRHKYFTFCVFVMFDLEILVFGDHNFFHSVSSYKLMLAIINCKLGNLSVQILIFRIKDPLRAVDFSNSAVFKIELFVIRIRHFLELVENHKTVQTFLVDFVLNEVDLGAQNFLKIRNLWRAVFLIRRS